jgi:hypothetical protein
MILTLAILFSLWRVTEPKDIQISYEASTNSYNPVPKELRLITVAVITRHGRVYPEIACFQIDTKAYRK